MSVREARRQAAIEQTYAEVVAANTPIVPRSRPAGDPGESDAGKGSATIDPREQVPTFGDLDLVHPSKHPDRLEAMARRPRR